MEERRIRVSQHLISEEGECEDSQKFAAKKFFFVFSLDTVRPIIVFFVNNNLICRCFPHMHVVPFKEYFCNCYASNGIDMQCCHMADETSYIYISLIFIGAPLSRSVHSFFWRRVVQSPTEPQHAFNQPMSSCEQQFENRRVWFTFFFTTCNLDTLGLVNWIPWDLGMDNPPPPRDADSWQGVGVRISRIPLVVTVPGMGGCILTDTSTDNKSMDRQIARTNLLEVRINGLYSSPTYKWDILGLYPTYWPFTNFLGHPSGEDGDLLFGDDDKSFLHAREDADFSAMRRLEGSMINASFLVKRVKESWT